MGGLTHLKMLISKSLSYVRPKYKKFSLNMCLLTLRRLISEWVPLLLDEVVHSQLRFITLFKSITILCGTVSTQSLYSVNGDFFMILNLFKDMVFQIKNKKNTKIIPMWLKKVICMGGTNQFGTNKCHHNKNLT